MSSRKTAKVAFASALVLLSLAGVAAFITIQRLSESTQWVTHTYKVQIAARELQATLTDAARARAAYISSPGDTYLNQYRQAVDSVPVELKHIADLTSDNPAQGVLNARLKDSVGRRLQILDASLELFKAGRQDAAAQAAYARENVSVASTVSGVIDDMVSQEESQLGQRTRAAHNLFVWVVLIIAVMIVSALCLFWIHYRLLSSELDERERAERNARHAEENALHLSSKLLRLQDEERRRFSRDLHDGLGQTLLAAKMLVTTTLQADESNTALAQCSQLIDQSIEETRTISHLLHPPLLEEVGFLCAAKWYVNGFAERSRIQVSLNIPQDLCRLPEAVEITLFRVLQESLTNIHRHAKSAKADVSIQVVGETLHLRIKDYGKGIPKQTLEQFLSTGSNVGVGLAGMKERIREQSGQLHLTSDGNGTVVSVIIPIHLEPPTRANNGLIAAASD